MGFIREPLHVDFEVVPKLLTKAEKEKISKYIKELKLSETTKKQHIAKNKVVQKKAK